MTSLGRMMDPIADKLLTSAAFISLVQLGLAPAWMVAVIIGRELAVTGLRSLASARGAGFGASMLGKIKMVSQVTAILLLILGQNGAQPFLWLGQVALWVVLLTALGSAVDYYRTYQSPPAPDTVARRGLRGSAPARDAANGVVDACSRATKSRYCSPAQSAAVRPLCPASTRLTSVRSVTSAVADFSSGSYGKLGRVLRLRQLLAGRGRWRRRVRASDSSARFSSSRRTFAGSRYSLVSNSASSLS